MRLWILALCTLFCAAPARAQVTQSDNTLQQQLVSDSFKITGSAIAQQTNWWWATTVTYAIANNSGMNLYLGVLVGSGSIG